MYYNTAMDCTNLMLYLVRDILDFSQIECKSFVLNYSYCNILSALEACISIFKLKAELKGIHLTFKYDCDTNKALPKTLYTDENRLKQIIINLISNAIKYTE